jgi:O-acetyl-ADP-ribose deacetylase (regulator of RNase III)
MPKEGVHDEGILDEINDDGLFAKALNERAAIEGNVTEAEASIAGSTSDVANESQDVLLVKSFDESARTEGFTNGAAEGEIDLPLDGGDGFVEVSNESAVAPEDTMEEADNHDLVAVNSTKDARPVEVLDGEAGVEIVMDESNGLSPGKSKDAPTLEPKDGFVVVPNSDGIDISMDETNDERWDDADEALNDTKEFLFVELSKKQGSVEVILNETNDSGKNDKANETSSADAIMEETGPNLAEDSPKAAEDIVQLSTEDGGGESLVGIHLERTLESVDKMGAEPFDLRVVDSSADQDKEMTSNAKADETGNTTEIKNLDRNELVENDNKHQNTGAIITATSLAHGTMHAARTAVGKDQEQRGEEVEPVNERADEATMPTRRVTRGTFSFGAWEREPDPIRCRTGSAVATGPGEYGRLGVRYVIHAVGPNFWDFGPNEIRHGIDLLHTAYTRSLDIAFDLPEVNRIAFCLLSAGLFRGSLKLSQVIFQGVLAVAGWRPLEEENTPEPVGTSAVPRSRLSRIYITAYTDRECVLLEKAGQAVFEGRRG